MHNQSLNNRPDVPIRTAVSAGEPDSDMVNLGKLTPAPEVVRMFGIRPGPHQLMQVEYENNSYEVIYVNSEQAGSLTYLMDAPATVDNAGSRTRPVYTQ